MIRKLFRSLPLFFVLLFRSSGLTRHGLYICDDKKIDGTATGSNVY